MKSIERDVLDRLDALCLPWHVTWALATYAEPRMTRDIDIVLDAGASDARGWTTRALARSG